jgi:hypothetical protein
VALVFVRYGWVGSKILNAWYGKRVRLMMLCCCQILRFKPTPVWVLLPIFPPLLRRFSVSHLSATCPMVCLSCCYWCSWKHLACGLTMLEQTLDALFFPPLRGPGYFFNHVSKQVHFLCIREDNHMGDLYNSYQVSCSCILIASGYS